MLLNKQEKEKKYALSLMRERRILDKQLYNIVPIKLDHPIQHGYVRNLEIRDDVKRRADYPKILEALNFIGQKKVYNSNINFIKFNRKSAIEQHAQLKSIIDPHHKFYYTEAKRKTDLDKIVSIEKYLRYHTSVYNCSCGNTEEYVLKRFLPHYYFKFPWMLKEVTRPHFLTHYTPVRGDIESRLTEINHLLHNNRYYEKFVNKRSSFDKLYKEEMLAAKYNDDKTVIYHSLREMDFTS